MNKRHFILPTIILALYVISIFAMRTAETQSIDFYHKHTALMEKLATLETKEAKDEAVQRFGQEFTTSQTEKNVAAYAMGAQYVIDKLTFGKKHCAFNFEQMPCKIYRPELQLAIQERKDRLLAIGKESYENSPLSYGTPYTPLDYVIKTITLLIEAFAVSWFIAQVYTKRKELRKFYQFTKFRAITAVILFVLIIGPALINDDWYFATPWIWYILAPPMLLEDLFGGPSDWIGVIIFWPLITLWFYTIATIIDKVRKSR